MQIKQIVSHHRRDFTAIYECQYCGHETRGTGYDDDHFHRNVIPAMKCDACGKSSGVVTSRATHPDHVVL